MMDLIDVARWRVRSDIARTRNAHAPLMTSGAAECGCDGCLNFDAYRDQLMQSPLGDLLTALGIEPPWEVEVYEFCQVAPGLHAYGGWYHFVGELISGEPAWQGIDPTSKTAHFEPLAAGIQIGLHDDCARVRPPFAGLPLVQLEIHVELPWVVSLPEPP